MAQDRPGFALQNVKILFIIQDMFFQILRNEVIQLFAVLFGFAEINIQQSADRLFQILRICLPGKPGSQPGNELVIKLVYTDILIFCLLFQTDKGRDGFIRINDYFPAVIVKSPFFRVYQRD